MEQVISYLPMDVIQLQNRQRKHFAKEQMQELQDDIATNGLINPITVNSLEEGFFLLAGERRLRSMTNLHREEISFRCGEVVVPPNSVPCLLLHNVSAEQAFEIELSENIKRSDLTWQEETEALARLHEMRSTQNTEQTYTQTAEEVVATKGGEGSVNSVRTKIRKAILINNFLEDEEVASASSEKEAFKIAARKMEREFTEARAVPVIKSGHTFIVGDMQEKCELLESSKYALVLTDPPYGMGVDKFQNAAKFRHTYDEGNFKELHAKLLEVANRVCLPQAHLYIFCYLEFFEELRGMTEEAGWRVRRAPLIWSKMNQGHLSDGAANGYRRTYELILSATRGGRQYNGLENDVLSYGFGGERYHAAQKPLPLYKDLIEMSTTLGEHVLDPFAGSGVIFGACEETDRIATGIEMDLDAAAAIEYHQQIRRG